MEKNKKYDSRGQSSHPGPGGNWPSTTGNLSGSNRGNAVPDNLENNIIHISNDPDDMYYVEYIRELNERD